jgi:hypothetical protein
MRFRELFEQFGEPVAFRVPSKIAAIKPRPDYRQGRKSTSYRVDPMPAYVPEPEQPLSDQNKAKASAAVGKPLPLRIGKEVIKPTDPRYAAIMRLIQKTQP